MAMTIESLLTEIETGVTIDEIRNAHEKLRAVLEVNRDQRERDTHFGRIKSEAIRSLREIEELVQKGVVSKKQGNTLIKEIKKESNIERVYDSNTTLFAHINVTGGDGNTPIGIVNDGVDSFSINVAIREGEEPDSAIVTSFTNMNYRVKIREDSGSIYDIINVNFVDGVSTFNYSTTNKASVCLVQEDDLIPINIGSVEYKIGLVGNTEFIIYRN